MKGQQTIRNREFVEKMTNVIDKWFGREMFAIVVICLSQLIAPLSYVYVNQRNFSPVQTNLARGIVTVFTHGFILYFLGISINVSSRQDLKYLIARCTLLILHQLTLSALYYVLSYPVLNTLSTTGPLFVFILDYLINKVEINRKQFVGIVLGLAGVLITINGDYLMTLIDDQYTIESDFKNYKVKDLGWKIFFSFLYQLFNMGWAFSIIIQKRISHMAGIKISFFMGIEFIISAGLVYSFGVISPMEASVFSWSCLYSGLVAVIAQIMFVCSLNLSKNSGMLTLSVFLCIITSYLVSYFKYNEKINILCVIGMFFIVLGLVKTVINKRP